MMINIALNASVDNMYAYGREEYGRMQRKLIVKMVKLSLCLTNQALRHKSVWDSGYIDPHFIDLGSS
jgi:hypothetical protein